MRPVIVDGEPTEARKENRRRLGRTKSRAVKMEHKRGNHDGPRSHHVAHCSKQRRPSLDAQSRQRRTILAICTTSCHQKGGTVIREAEKRGLSFGSRDQGDWIGSREEGLSFSFKTEKGASSVSGDFSSK
ncbi:hypothetical protein SESBI_35411 [Sesbania bispinosa]|nr:hypothetical protein SESBI_35411 [Sesbania bispinosa]